MKEMTLEQLNELIKYIQEKHAFGRGEFGKSAWVKYIDPHFDFRDNMVFAIQFRGLFEDQNFYTANEFRDAEPMYDRIMAWLKSFEDKK